jgi:glycosyltransferase involved in cell wall biosynthesis
MRLLYITAEVPWPLTSGYLRHFHFLRGLSERHEIVQLSLTRRTSVPDDARAALAPFVERLEVFGAGAGEGAALPGTLQRSLHLRRAARALRRAVAGHLARDRFDAVIFSGKDTFPALRAVRGTPLVVDVCDAASVRLEGELAIATGRRRLPLALRLAEVRLIERRLAARTPHLLFASERDREAVPAARGRGVVVPNGLDLAHWTRTAPPASGERIAFTGVMAYRPNHDAALRLVRDLLPRIRAERPAAEVVVAGRDPLPALLEAAAGRPEVAVTGACPDLRPHVEGSAVYCAPLRFASGIQNKLLEALAMEVPVVTTTVAAAGLRVAGEDAPLRVADDDDALAAAVAGLLGDPAERDRLAAAGRRYVERHFSWERAVALLEDELLRAAGAAAGRPSSPADDLLTATTTT